MYGICQQTVNDINVGVHGVQGAESGLHVGSDLGLAGVLGDSQNFSGVVGLSIWANGVVGLSQRGRGGIFDGGAAAVKLSPSSAPNPPTAGETGDLMVDSTGRLWFCKRGGSTATWVNLA